MPLWIIYHPHNTFTDIAERSSLSNAITKVYTAGNLPAFYVNVVFVPVAPDNFFIGGVPRPSPHTSANEPGPDSSKPFIRITIQNIARKIPSVKSANRFLSVVDQALKPFIADKGYDWEYSVEETSRDLWKIDGLVPPMPNTEAEKEWVRLNRAVEFEPEKGGLPKL
ncbi:putative oxalocrotonate tautomerase [Dendryphion nanum]|uniref:Oxalocrotonate tautomerase n=1 Tax=Dendryphion nanum TaxID=256645 RepID=A0A9P9DRJ9_9PLEO|nr:putative oxalocrotonate tautomerase [Dendryphion nanum]